MDTMYFKDMSKKNDKGIPQVIYRVEPGKIFIEVLDPSHKCGCSQYFSSIQKRDEFVNKKKEHILRINAYEVKSIIENWI